MNNTTNYLNEYVLFEHNSGERQLITRSASYATKARNTAVDFGRCATLLLVLAAVNGGPGTWLITLWQSPISKYLGIGLRE